MFTYIFRLESITATIRESVVDAIMYRPHLRVPCVCVHT